MLEQSRSSRELKGLQNLQNVKARIAGEKAQAERVAAQQKGNNTTGSGSTDDVKTKYVYEPHKFKRDNGNNRNTIFNSSR